MPRLDHAGLHYLGLEECTRLIDSVPVGRIAFVEAGDPRILPVNHAREGRSIVFRTGAGSKLEAGLRLAHVAFEVDDWDPETRTGWSVMVVGDADIVPDDEVEQLEKLGLEPWGPADLRTNWIRILPYRITGRRLAPAAVAAAAGVA